MAEVNGYVHPLPASTALLSFLSSHLPYSLPLLRRLQFRGDLSSTAALIASFPPLIFSFSDPSSVTTCVSTTVLAVEPPFAIGHFDRSSRPGTEAWLFSSMELAQSPSGSDAFNSPGKFARHQAEIEQVLAIFVKFAQVCPSPNSSTPSTFVATRDGNASNTVAYSTTSEDVIVIGSLHRNIRDSLSKHLSGCLRDDIVGPGGPYQKYIIPVTSIRSQISNAPHVLSLPSVDLIYCTVEPSDYEFIMAQNNFVRSTRTLYGLPNCGIRHAPTGQLVAFAFIGSDGSLKTLHVEPHWRGMNLGGLLAKVLLTRRSADFTRLCFETKERALKVSEYSVCDVVEDEYLDIAHADVSATNYASVKLFEKLGVTPAWEVFWVRIDLKRII